MPPPGFRPVASVGGTWDTDKAKRRDAAIIAANRALADANVTMSPSKVSRLIAKFDRAAGAGRSFHEFLTTEAHLPPSAIRRLMAHPEWHRVIAYSDPTGEAAVNNVLRAVRHGQG